MKWQKIDLAMAVGLALAAFIVRLPFRSQYLYHWDSVNFALSLTQYDVRLHQPHPPGYFLYSMLGRLVNLWMLDGNASLVWISLIGGVLGVVAMFWLGSVLFGRQAGVVAALLVLASPIHWFHSEIALSYALEFLLVTVIAGLSYLQITGSPRIWPWLTILLGVAGGIRQNDLVFLLPLWLVALKPLSWRQRMASVGLLVLVGVSWLVPMALMSGGFSEYLSALRAGGEVIVEESPFLAPAQFALNGARLALYIAYGLGIGVMLLPVGLGLLPRSMRALAADRRAWVLTLWIVPSVLFYLLVHVRQPGHVFTFLPALILLVAIAAIRVSQRWRAPRQALTALTVLLLASNVAFFLFAPVAPLGSIRLPLLTPSRATLTTRDNDFRERLEYIRTHFDPGTTVVVAGGLDFRHPDYYFQDFQLPALSYRLGADAVPLPTEVRTLVLLNELTLPDLRTEVPIETVRLPGGSILRYYSWSESQEASLSDTSLVLMPR